MIASHRMSQALGIAVQAHAGQVRKGTNIPYIAHPMAVCAIALEYGADEDQAAAALLHDVLEDGGADYEPRIRELLGERVLTIVKGCTDGTPDANGNKAPWQQRKEAYLAHLRHASADVLLVSGSDKLHNARAIVSDLQAVGLEVFERFSSSMEQTLWYYRSLADILEQSRVPMAESLRREVERMCQLSNASVAQAGEA